MKRLHGPYGAANPSLAEAKAELRARMRKVRKRLARDFPDAAIHTSVNSAAPHETSPSPLAGEGGPRRGSDEGSTSLSAQTAEVTRMGRRDPSSVGFADTFSRKGRRTRIVASYRPQGSELDPGPLIETLVADGWQAALPRASDHESPLTFHPADGPLEPDAFGIPAPLPTSQRLTPDLVLVPVLAFDRFGGRLGQGAGCYDRTLAALRAAGPVRAIGLAYAGQEVDRVPTDDHDQPLDGILTDKSWVEVVRHPA